jgi:arylsulfatase
MDRRGFLTAVGGLTALWAGAGRAQGRPNVVLMIADDVGWNDLGCFGHPTIRTPNIDAIAAGGVRFANAFLPVSSCSPSRCCMITGRYPHSTGAQHLHDPLPADQVCFPRLLQDAGYHTMAAGKWHLGPAAQQAFDRVAPPGDASGCANWLPVLRERPKDQPFFAWLAAVDAHRDWSPDAMDPPYRPEDAQVPPYLPDTAEVRGDLASYYNEITRLDQHVGRVLAELEAQGVADNTLVMFVSDNGRPFPRCKTTVYDSGADPSRRRR